MSQPSQTGRRTPAGIHHFIIRNVDDRDRRHSICKCMALVITFIAYACYHASRKPPGIVKSVLQPHPNPKLPRDAKLIGDGWAPFEGPDGATKLGEIDVAFLGCYALAMYIAGHLGDKLDLRLFITAGMIGSGIFVGIFGMGYFWNVHSFWFYLVIQMIAGLFEATGWPCVVAVVGNWCGESRRGLIMGVWNAHTSAGNISGSLLAASVLEFGWGWSFIVPAVLMVSGGLLVYFFLPAYQEDARRDGEEPNSAPVVGVSIGIVEAFKLPGVRTYALCNFFAKPVAYTFLYWLPYYLSRTETGGEYISVKSAGNLSALFDIGGIFGGILAGYISDKLKAPAITAASFLYAATLSMLFYRWYGNLSMNLNIALMAVTGLFVNGPYSLITTAVSADLATQNSLRHNARARATVTAIIDGTGSVGAVIGPLLTGFISRKGWDGVFIMLTSSSFVAALLLSRIVIDEVANKIGRPEHSSATSPDPAAPASEADEPLLEDSSTGS